GRTFVREPGTPAWRRPLETAEARRTFPHVHAPPVLHQEAPRDVGPPAQRRAARRGDPRRLRPRLRPAPGRRPGRVPGQGPADGGLGLPVLPAPAVPLLPLP